MTASLQSCLDENLVNNETSDTKATERLVYMTIDLKPSGPKGTRAPETADGTEVGIEKENIIKSVRVLLAEKVTEGESFDYKDEINLDCKYKVISYADVNGLSLTPDNNKQVKVVVPFEESDLEEYFMPNEGSEAESKDIYVFIAANHGDKGHITRPVKGEDVQRIILSEQNKDLEKTGDVRETVGSFLMTSLNAFPIKLDWGKIKRSEDIKNPTNLNKLHPDYLEGNPSPIEIHRTMARIDLNYKNLKFAMSKNSQNIYISDPIPPENGEDEETELRYPETPDNTDYVLTIEQVALANQSKNYYLYQETGSGNDWNIFGQELFNNIVRDPFSNDKINYADGAQFFQPLIEYKTKKLSAEYQFRKVNDFASPAARKLNDISGQTSAIDNADYALWHYANPNSIHDYTKQLKKNSTVVIYKARITDGSDGQIISNAEDTGADIYALGNELFGTFSDLANSIEESYGRMLYKAVIDDYIPVIKQRIKDLEDAIADLEGQITSGREKGEDVNSLIQDQTSRENRKSELLLVLDQLEETTEVEGENVTSTRYTYPGPQADSEAEELLQEVMKNLNFRIYRAENIAEKDQTPVYRYYCYYFYWIRHNDNSNNASMGNMEFAIVRNFIYKLNVKGIYGLGYPDNPNDDPDPLIPEEEVEKQKTQIEVETLILPWNLRKDYGAILD